MAILSSFSSGKSRKSVGSVTYTRLNGQNIAKAKIARNPNRKFTESQMVSQIRMAALNNAYKAFKPITDKIYSPTKLGSAYNSFIKVWMDVYKTTHLSKVYDWQPDSLNEAHDTPLSDYLASFSGYPSTICPYSAGGIMKLTTSIYPKRTDFHIGVEYEDGSQLTDSANIQMYCICSNDEYFEESKVLNPGIGWTYELNGGAGSYQSTTHLEIPYDYMIFAIAITEGNKLLSSSKMRYVELFD